MGHPPSLLAYSQLGFSNSYSIYPPCRGQRRDQCSCREALQQCTHICLVQLLAIVFRGVQPPQHRGSTPFGTSAFRAAAAAASSLATFMPSASAGARPARTKRLIVFSLFFCLTVKRLGWRSGLVSAKRWALAAWGAPACACSATQPEAPRRSPPPSRRSPRLRP